ncbi:hypothetical protein MLD38_009048 [Melastoma candidum]|uniref:Uncharacterized protein n=1 Tax=Melastoma candidum TaxID=119954 RepID=A0ACB9S0M7_9MYRT|nr:hypothetical protein MLD38_009048 [Melastoma candidum]
MDFSCCPVCDLFFPLSELERHVNRHFEGESDVVASVSSSNLLPETREEDTSRPAEGFYTDFGDDPFCTVDERRNGYKTKDGLMHLLKKCLEAESGKSNCVLSGYIDHYESVKSKDLGWGCGWRNIQMLASHVLTERQETRDLLFGGSGVVPDILSLQRWLEIAWKGGFDVPGAEHFNHHIYGLRSWIGTTECAALFRSFGVRARVVDFGPKKLESLFLSVPGSEKGEQPLGNKRKVGQIYGPIDRFLARKDPVSADVYSSMEDPSCSRPRNDENVCGSTRNSEEISDLTNGEQHALVDWVWKYFTDRSCIKNCSSPVMVTTKSPLYFQHEGHSRTIVGIQLQHQANGKHKFSLLVLDPAARTADIMGALRGNSGWQKLIKRGAHTLRHSQYQLCYIDFGISQGEDMEQLKTIHSIYINL